jgi:hypothetical protein
MEDYMPKLPYLFRLTPLFMAGAILASCGDGNGNPVDSPIPTTGGLTVSAVVPDGGVEGVEIGITGPETASDTTDASGNVVFSEIAPGTYTVSIVSAPTSVEFVRTSRSVLVPAGGSASVSFLGANVGS